MPVTRKSENMRDGYFPNMQPIQEKCNQAPTNEGDVQPNHELPLPIRAPLFILLLFFFLLVSLLLRMFVPLVFFCYTPVILVQLAH